MKPAPFTYHAPERVDEVVGLLRAHGDEAKVLAGGQSLVPMLNLRLTRFEHLVDVGRVRELRTVTVGAGGVRLGATVPQYEIEERPDIATAAPLLATATPLIGHFQIRSRGTVGGSLAHADPAAEYPAVALALDAEIEAVGPDGTRSIPATEFFTGTWETALDVDEVLTAVYFPSWHDGAGFAVEEVARRHGDFAIAGACAAVHVADRTIDRGAIALFGVASVPVRATGAERALVGCTVEEVDIAAIAQETADDLDPPDDLHASSELRRRIARAVVGRALRRAINDAAGERHGA